MENKWNIIHDLSVVYQYFVDLGNENESNFMHSLMRMEEEIEKWEFEINNELYGIKHKNPENYDELYDLMMSKFVPSPLDQMNSSMENLVNYFNAEVLDGRVINLLFNSINKCIGDDICEGQIHQMEYYTKMWMSASPDLKILNSIMQFKLTANNPESLISDMVDNLDTKTIESSKKESRIEISRKWTVSDFKNYDVWLSQRLNTDKNIKPEMIEIHRSIHDFVMDNFPNIDVKYVLDGASLKHPNGKKVGNINVFSGKGVVLNLLRSEKDGFRLPNINHKCVNARNDIKNCSYYFITDISVLDSEIKEQLQNSYDIRDKNKNTLTNKHPQIKEILGI